MMKLKDLPLLARRLRPVGYRFLVQGTADYLDAANGGGGEYWRWSNCEDDGYDG
jgi:hypothetical protein